VQRTRSHGPICLQITHHSSWSLERVSGVPHRTAGGLQF
jgi:hypothetical protein